MFSSLEILPNGYESSYLAEEDAQDFLRRISPPRDLICPITLTIFFNPVIALGDGQTYEKESILMWLQTQRNEGGIRSPVSNAYMEGSNIMGIVPNKAVRDMARHFRENLGKELCLYVEAITNNSTLGDGGYRIRNLVEMGADLCLKGENGNTAFMSLVRRGQLDLVLFILTHKVSVTSTNEEGLSVVDFVNQKSRNENSSGWRRVLKIVEEKEKDEIRQKREQEETREENNAQQRERQRELASEARAAAAMSRNGIMVDGNLIQNGLGSLENGYGYFPSLCTLQFQGNIPPPSATFAETEELEKTRLNSILKWVSGAVLIIWIFG